MQKATNINKLYNYWTDFERIYLSKIYEILSCTKKYVHLKPTCIFLTLKEKQCMYMYYLLVNIKKVLLSNKYYWEMKNNLAQFTVL